MRIFHFVRPSIAFALLFAPGCVQGQASQGEPYEPYGMCDHLDWRWFYKTDDEIRRTLDMMKDAGVQWMRMGLDWQALEPEKGKFSEVDWPRVDFVVAESLARGIQPYFNFIATPRWASTNPDEKDSWMYAPKDLADLDRFMRRAAARYRGKVRHWEVNNEIDWQLFWKSGFKAYVDYLKTVHDALKAVDPRNQVIMAGLATDGVHSFEYQGLKAEENALQRLYDLGAKPYFDILALHPYSQKPDGAEISVAKVEAAYAVMTRNGDEAKPIWCNEFGLSTAQNPWAHWSEEDQARALTEGYPRLLALKPVQKVFWYNFRCKGTDPKDQEHNYGMVNNTLSPRKAYYAYQEITRAAASSPATRRRPGAAGARP